MSEGLRYDFTDQFAKLDELVEGMRQDNSDSHILGVVIPEIIASFEVGAITPERVLSRLQGRPILDPEKFIPEIERMISIDTGKERGDN